MEIAPRRALTYTVLAALTAAGYLFAFRAAGSAPRPSFIFAVLALAAGFNLIWWVVRNRPRRQATRTERVTSVVLALLTITATYSTARALATLDSGAVAVLFQTEIILVAVIAWLTLGERVDRWLVTGGLVAGLGVIVGQLPGVEASWDAVGVAWGMGAALSFALILVVSRAVVHAVDLERVNAARLTLAAPLALLVPGAAARLGELDASMWGWAALAAAAGPLLSRLLQFHALRGLQAATVKLGMLSTALFAYLFEAAGLAHYPVLRDLPGAALILLGLVIAAGSGSIFGRSR